MEHLSAAASVDALACQELVELATDYLESALSLADRSRFEQHIAECEGCQNYLDQVRHTIRLCGTRTEDPIPAATRKEFLEHFQDWKRR